MIHSNSQCPTHSFEVAAIDGFNLGPMQPGIDALEFTEHNRGIMRREIVKNQPKASLEDHRRDTADEMFGLMDGSENKTLRLVMSICAHV